MSANEMRHMLGEYFSMDILANTVEKKLLGGYEIRGLSVIFTELWVFQKGAILGRAKADKIKSLAKLVAQEGSEDSVCEFFRKTAEETLKEYGKAPSSFFDFYMKTSIPSLDFTDVEILKALSQKKVKLEETIKNFQTSTSLGIGFGAINPELVEKMWEEPHDPMMWENARKHGLNLPENYSSLPLKEMEEIVLSQVYEFTKDNKPDLVTELGLKHTS